VSNPQEHRKYKNAPINEAVCQFVFAGEPVVDPLLPGRLFELVGNFYSARPNLFLEQSVQFNHGIGVSLPTQKVQLLSNDKKRLLMVGPNSLSIHDLNPYSGWEKFKPRITRALECHQKIAGIRSICQISLRYINRIILPSDTTELKDFFKSMPERPERSEIPQNIASLFMRLEFLYDESPGYRAIISIGNTPLIDEEKGIPVLLDIDVSYSPVKNESELEQLIPESEIVKVVEELRNKEYWLFESMITDKARGLFV
jgi:uncharacterized protein (TIGR04255 family)